MQRHWLDIAEQYWVVEEHFPDGFGCEAHFESQVAAVRYAAQLHEQYTLVHTRIYQN